MKKTNAVRILEKHHIVFEPVEYTYDPENLEVAHIARENNLRLEQVCKTLVCQGDKTGVIVAVVPGHHNLDLKALAQASGNKKIAMVPVRDLLNLTGYIRGGCSPIGMKKDFPVFIDLTAKPFEKIYINAGIRGLLVGLPPEALATVTRAQWAMISE